MPDQEPQLLATLDDRHLLDGVGAQYAVQDTAGRTPDKADAVYEELRAMTAGLDPVLRCKIMCAAAEYGKQCSLISIDRFAERLRA